MGETLGPTSLVVGAPQLQECLILDIKYSFIPFFVRLGAVDGPRAAGKDQHSAAQSKVFTRPQVWMP